MIMCKLARPQRNATRTTHRRGSEIVCKLCPLVTEILLDERLVVQRIDSAVLVIGEEDEEIWFLVAVVWGAGRMTMTVVVGRKGTSFGGWGVFGLGGDDLGE